MMELRIKRFQELTAEELYSILRLRVGVFVVEQQCPYQELDGLDLDALHIWLEDEEGIKAYLRVLGKGAESEYCAIGRVIAVKRRCGLGSRIMREGVKAARDIFGAQEVYLEAQSYVRNFYERQGFVTISDEFLLDGIPHIKMLLKITDDLIR